jgi:hypothetical protein
MDEPMRRKGEVWCVMIGTDRDWVRSGGGIYMVAGCSHGWKNVHDRRKGSQTLRTTRKILSNIENSRKPIYRK